MDPDLIHVDIEIDEEQWSAELDTTTGTIIVSRDGLRVGVGRWDPDNAAIVGVHSAPEDLSESVYEAVLGAETANLASRVRKKIPNNG